MKFLPTHLLLPILGPALSLALLAACSPTAVEISKVPVPAGAPVSRAFGIWTPNTVSGDTCSKEIHDQYWTYGPDGKVYPSWHPPVDASGCKFGHEHGRNPKDSKLISLTLPFGYVNEQLSPNDPLSQRNEDHVGHKVEWANEISISRDDRPYTKCDVLFKLHQGTHSPDALTNNLHELFYYASCGDGTKIQWRNLQAFGHGGNVHTDGCKTKAGAEIAGAEITVGAPVPANSPNGGGERKLPAKNCVESKTLVAKGDGSDGGVLHENWIVGLFRQARPGPNKDMMSFSADPYFQVNNPSRYVDITSANKVSRPIDLCLKRGDLEWRGNDTCDTVRTQAAATGTMAYTDPRSPFNGAERDVHMNGLRINNAGGPTKWYSDVFGEKLQTSPDASKGIILEQFIGSVDNTPGGKRFNGPTLSGDYNHEGVHAPN